MKQGSRQGQARQKKAAQWAVDWGANGARITRRRKKGRMDRVKAGTEENGSWASTAGVSGPGPKREGGREGEGDE